MLDESFMWEGRAPLPGGATGQPPATCTRAGTLLPSLVGQQLPQAPTLPPPKKQHVQVREQ